MCRFVIVTLFYFTVENMFANMFNQAAIHPGPQIPGNPTGIPQAAASTTSALPNQVPISQPFPFMGAPVPPPFPFMAPFTIPPPPMPPNLSSLTDEELRALEGSERQNVENRIKVSCLCVFIEITRWSTLRFPSYNISLRVEIN